MNGLCFIVWHLHGRLVCTVCTPFQVINHMTKSKTVGVISHDLLVNEFNPLFRPFVNLEADDDDLSSVKSSLCRRVVKIHVNLLQTSFQSAARDSSNVKAFSILSANFASAMFACPSVKLASPTSSPFLIGQFQ
jgi:hypothetical protein